MALVFCTKCGHRISATAIRCPGCRAPGPAAVKSAAAAPTPVAASGQTPREPQGRSISAAAKRLSHSRASRFVSLVAVTVVLAGAAILLVRRAARERTASDHLGKGSTAKDTFAPWPMFLHDSLHTGLSQFSTADNGGVRKWKFDAAGASVCSPVVGVDGTIYVSLDNGKLCAVNQNGSLKWSFNTKWTPNSPAVGADGTIYVDSGNYLYAVDPNGSLKWKFFVAEVMRSPPTVGPDETIYFGSETGLWVVNPGGTLKWKFSTGDVNSPPTVGLDGTVYFVSGDSLYAVNPNRTLKWKFVAGTGTAGPPAVSADGTIYVGGSNLSAFDRNGHRKWYFPPGIASISSPAVGADGTIYFGSAPPWRCTGGTGSLTESGSPDNCLYALKPDGRPKWYFGISGVVSSPAIGADGTIFFGATNFGAKGHYLYAVNSDGRPKWKFLSGGWLSSPAIGGDGTIYFGTSEDEYEGRITSGLYALH